MSKSTSKRTRKSNDTLAATAEGSEAAGTTDSETKEQTMVRLAKGRVPRAIQAIRAVGNLASYKPSPTQTERIMNTLRSEVDAVERSLLAGKASAVAFELSE